ncbi:MAG: efflux RND transporter permease subunit [Planctomycetota bacterium]
MNRLIELAVKQPITVAVGVILAVMAGVIAMTSVPIQMSPVVDSAVVSVTTNWENASAAEIESDVIEQQERFLGEVSNLVSMTSVSQSGRGQVRLEFATGTDIDAALAEVDQKLAEVPGYPDGVDEPALEGIDPESVDYIAWIGLSATDPSVDATTLHDFMERRLKQRFERVPGVLEVGIRGGRESEVQVRIDRVALAQRGITYRELMTAIERTNENFSGGRLAEGKNDLRIRSVGRFEDVQEVADTVIRRDAAGPVYVRDVAEVELSYKEPTDWVKARGVLMPFFNFQMAPDGNMLETMAGIQDEVAALNAPGGLLEQEAQRLGIPGTIELVQTWDSSTYVRDAIALVQSNILVGGVLAVITLLLFLRSLRTIGIIAVAIPISVIASMVVMVALGRSINIISLAGMAFAVGMVVDNAIVVIENIFRHLEMGKNPRKAAVDGATEVAGAVVASTATTLVVFFPILLIQEQAGQLFRDIAIAIMAAVGLSLIVSLTVIPSAAALLLKPRITQEHDEREETQEVDKPGRLAALVRAVRRVFRTATRFPEFVGGVIFTLIGTWPRRLAVIAAFAGVTSVGTYLLIPPMDYLPRGNRNVAFNVMVPPPGYTLDQLRDMGERIQETVQPAWEATEDKFVAESNMRGMRSEGTGETFAISANDPANLDLQLKAPALDHHFMVAFDGRLFQAGIPQDPSKVVDVVPLLDYASRQEVTSGDVFGFTFQFPLFRTGGTTGSAIKIDLAGDDLDVVSAAGGALFGRLLDEFGPGTVTPEPVNFMLPTPELRIRPNDERVRDLGMDRSDVGLAMAINGDGYVMPRQFQSAGELKDIKLITQEALNSDAPIEAMLNAPIAAPTGNVLDLRSLASVDRVREANQIKHANRTRAVTLQFTPPPTMALSDAIVRVDELVAELRDEGAITPGIEVEQAGSAGALNQIREALLGDGTLLGTASSSLFLAFAIVYLVMVLLFQSWAYPLVIMVSVPLATFGGFLGLALVHEWSVADRYMPVQNLDVLPILGFVILAGVVVNNAILLVHQSLNYLRGTADKADCCDALEPREAIRRATASRVRPIMMSTLTSVGGMLPLVLLPGSGSELYRGLGAVVVGGLLISTVFTLLLVPVILSAVFEVQAIFRKQRSAVGQADDVNADALART